MSTSNISCNDPRPCFAKRKCGKSKYRCGILIESYRSGKCPFRKANASITKGQEYPYNADYSSGYARKP